MKKKKGFTLVELLAVIVILAITSLIAVPLILGVIEKSRRGALQNSGYGLVEAGNLYNAQYQNPSTVRFDIKDNEITTNEENQLVYKGTIKEGTVLINNKGEVVVCINDGKYAAYKNFSDNKVTIVDNKTCTIPKNSNIVYLDNEATVDTNINDLITEIQELKEKVSSQEQEIANLKSNQSDMMSSINNITTTHASDFASLSNQFNSFSNMINNRLNLSNKEIISKTVTVPSETYYYNTELYTFTASKDGLYIFNGYVTFSGNPNGVIRLQVVIDDTITADQRNATGNYIIPMIPISEVHYLKAGQSVQFVVIQGWGTDINATIDLIIESSN